MRIPEDRPTDLNLEQDDRFPSGPWEGYYLQPEIPGRHDMELFLTFHDTEIHGEGRDCVGEFLMKGTYEKDSGKCWWSKRYIGKHDVAYQGYNEGRGIWGTWEITPQFKGGFHIWPFGQGNGESSVAYEKIDAPLEHQILIVD